MSGSIAATAAAASVVGAGTAAYGAMKQGQETSAAEKYQAQLASNNAAIASQNATLAGQAGEQQVGMADQKTKAEIGAVIAGEAGSGIDVAGKTATDVQKSEQNAGMQDALNIRANAARTAYGYETQAAGYQGQAALDQMSAANATQAGETSAASDFFGGIGSAGSGWENYKAKTSGLGSGS